MVLPHKVWGDYFQAFHGEKTFSGKKIMAKFLILNGRTSNDQIKLMWEKSFINDRCIFQ